MAALKAKREKEEEDRVKAMGQKEREEWKRRRDRLSGKSFYVRHIASCISPLQI